MINHRRKRSTSSKTIRMARERLASCVLTIGLLISSSLALAEDRLLDVAPDDTKPIEIRIGATHHEFVTTKQIAFVIHAAAPRWLHANRLELGLGAISQTDESRPFVSLGPVWRWAPATVNDRWFIDFGISPTILGGGKFQGKDLGGNLQFTSSLAIGRRFGPRSASSVSLRIQHISNGGLNNTNPGVDMFVLGFTHRPEGQRRR